MRAALCAVAAVAMAMVVAEAATPGFAAQKTCFGDYCTDVATWCPAQSCAAYNLGVPVTEKDHPDMVACRRIKMASVKKLDKSTDTAYCISQDATTRGFQCFRGSRWFEKLMKFLRPDYAVAPGPAHLNRMQTLR